MTLGSFRIFSKIRGDIRGSNLTTGISDTGGKLPPVSTTPAANLPPVSTTPVANNGNNIRLLTPESEVEGKNVYMCNLYYPKVSQQNYKKFSDWRFFHLPPVSTTPVVNLDLRISPRIFEKIWNGPNGILWGWGETDWWKKPEAKNLVTLSL